MPLLAKPRFPVIAGVIPVNEVRTVGAVGTAAGSSVWFPVFAGGTDVVLGVSVKKTKVVMNKTVEQARFVYLSPLYSVIND